MADYKEIIEEFRTFYVKGFIGLMEVELVYLKNSNQFAYLNFLKHLSNVTGEAQQSLRESIPKTIKVLIKGYKDKLL